MPKFVRVEDPDTGHQFDVAADDGRLLAGELKQTSGKDAVIEGPFVRPREAKFRTTLDGIPAGKGSTRNTASEA